jgi:formate dehydrogenase beta subunit
MDKYIRGESLPEPEKKTWVTLSDSEINAREPNYDVVPRQEMQMLPAEERQGSFNIVELGLNETQARREADRCLKCNLSITVVAEECILCGRCSSVCPVDALEQVDADTGGPHKPHVSRDGIVIRHTDVCIRCGNCKDCPVDAISMKSVYWEPDEESNKLLKIQAGSGD